MMRRAQPALAAVTRPSAAPTRRTRQSFLGDLYGPTVAVRFVTGASGSAGPLPGGVLSRKA
jgi:hypothetical protein